MFGVWSSLLLEVLGMVMAGLTIKLMDDWLDHEYDQCVGRTTLSIRLGRACLPYALICLALAMALAPEVSLPLFLAAYAIGMGHDLRERMPTKLPGWLESLLALGIAMLYAGPLTAVWALFAMGMVQLLDDLMDVQKDRRSGQNNLAIRFGLVEVTMLMFICLLAAVLISPMHTVELMLATPLVHILISLLSGMPPRERGEET